MTCRYSLLDEPLIRTRLVADGNRAHYTLPGLFVALATDVVRDFPALRPHQRHPWHAFLVQLAAMAMHHAGQSQPFASEAEWKEALLELTPAHPDGEAWCLVVPHDKPAFMQAPVPTGKVEGWKNQFHSPDEIDMLVTSKNHDLKAARMKLSAPDDWIVALVSLQTQEGFLGAGNYGISRMNGGFASRPALGAVPQGHWGHRWHRDVSILLERRSAIAEEMGLKQQGGLGLIWLLPWNGHDSLSFSSLDPFYIEICRRIRLVVKDSKFLAVTTTTKAARIDAKSRNGITGDPWIPVDVGAEKALTITSKGFDYQLAVELLFSSKYRPSIAQELFPSDGTKGIVMLAQGVTRGQGKTEGYHERRIPVSPTMGSLILQRKTDIVAKVAEEHVQDVSRVQKLLWTSTATLFDNGAAKEKFSDSAKDKANIYSRSFEQGEDTRFFDELNAEIESENPDQVRLNWHLSMADRAEVILRNAFDAGPRNGEQRYRARAAALLRFHGGLRSGKVLPSLAQHFRQQQASKENAHDPACS